MNRTYVDPLGHPTYTAQYIENNVFVLETIGSAWDPMDQAGMAERHHHVNSNSLCKHGMTSQCSHLWHPFAASLHTQGICSMDQCTRQSLIVRLQSYKTFTTSILIN